MDEVIHSAVKLVKGCSCKKGCAACVGDHRLDKEMVLFGLENLLEHWDVPMDVKVAEYGPSTFRRKEFQFEKLEEQWGEFCKRIRENGESFAAFLQTVPSVEIRDRMLILKLTNSFYADWVMEPGNRTSLKNIICYYADVPARIPDSGGTCGGAGRAGSGCDGEDASQAARRRRTGECIKGIRKTGNRTERNGRNCDNRRYL